MISGVSARCVALGDICAYIRGCGVNLAYETRPLYIRFAPVIIPCREPTLTTRPLLRRRCPGGCESARAARGEGDDRVPDRLMERLVFGGRIDAQTLESHDCMGARALRWRGISKSITGLLRKPINEACPGER